MRPFALITLAMCVFRAIANTETSNPASKAYDHVTLRSSLMSAKVFMPTGNMYYKGSRFEYGSMIGDFVYGNRLVYGRGLWRVPHDPTWPESGVGLASEFGCGNDGATCVGKDDITNGVLGYESAKAGEPFLKIGVGALIKGSCPDCVGDENGVYRFNSPYAFYRDPKWDVISTPGSGPNEVTVVSEEVLGDVGYRIEKTIRLDGNVFTVRSILTNLGKKQFTTPWYSHHFFSGDEDPIGPGYRLDLGLSKFGLTQSSPIFKQSGLGSWSGDLNDYANVTMADDGSISIAMKKEVPEGVRLKGEFFDDNVVTLTDGSFTLRAPNGVSVCEKIPELRSQSRNPFIFAYNVYLERGTLSPEPILLLYLQPGETTSWTQNLKFSGPDANAGSSSFLSMLALETWQVSHAPSWRTLIMMSAVSALVVSLYTQITSVRRDRNMYSAIPDSSSEEQPCEALRVV